MKNISATLATVWRIAGPYFRSEDKWAGRGLLGVVVVMELALVAINVLLNQWQNRFYSALQAYDLNEFVMRGLDLPRPGLRLRRAWPFTSFT